MSAQELTPDQVIQQLQDKIVELKEQVKELAPHVPEATYAFNATLINAISGIRGQWTIRARPGETGESFLFRVEAMVKKLNERNWGDNIQLAPQSPTPAPFSVPQPAPQGVSTPPPAPTNGNGNSGTWHALLMKVGTSYTGNKPQLNFECAESEHPLRYTRPPADMVKLLSQVGQYTPVMLQDGAKFSVNYLVDWEMGQPNSEGKRYQNILAVRPNR